MQFGPDQVKEALNEEVTSWLEPKSCLNRIQHILRSGGGGIHEDPGPHSAMVQWLSEDAEPDRAMRAFASAAVLIDGRLSSLFGVILLFTDLLEAA